MIGPQQYDGPHTAGCAVWNDEPCDCPAREDGAVRRQCGTTWGYQLHRKHDEVACDACRTAWATAERVRVGGPRVKRALRPCGTVAAYTRHKRRREPACEPCRAANAAASQLSELRRIERERVAV